MKDESYFAESRIDGKLMFDGTVLHVMKDRIRLPDGNEGIREYCRHGGAVAVVPLTDDGKIVCVRQYRYALGRVTLEIPAGKLDYAGEVPLDAAVRELREETGYSAKSIVPIGELNTSPALLTEVIYMYLAEGLTPGDTDPDDDEFLEIVELPLDELVDMVISGEIKDAKTQAAILKVWAMKTR